VRGLGLVKPKQQLENLIEWFSKMKAALPDAKI
jgi:transcription-repair coupling factor (superfamily II helicase)